MAGFRLFTSNRLEILFEYLAQVLEGPLPSPLDQEIIVVQSKGMERWISMKLAQKFGIWGNGRYPFPKAVIRELFKMVTPDIPDDDPFDPKALTWRIMKSLSFCTGKAGFEVLRKYLGDEANNLKRLQLAEQLAKIFDRYMVFRPEWIFAWEEGKEDHWQARLWRDLVGSAAAGHIAALRKVFLERVGQTTIDPEKFPARVSIFGISNLAPMYMDVFASVARHLEVNLFLMSPCREFWFDIVSEKEAAKIQKKIGRKKINGKALSSDELHLDTGHPLLASMGKQGAHFFQKVFDLFEQIPENLPHAEETRFEDPDRGGLLSCLQSDILNLRDRGSGEWEKKTITINDNSIQVHACHSPMREIEVLYDHLLDFFETNPDLEPGDILVMTPDISKYAPYIFSVFEGRREGEKKIPYSVADRSARREGQVVEVFLEILGLYGSRFGQTQILDVLESPAVRKRFGLQEQDLEPIRRWVESTRIRWGVDGKDRGRMGVPEFEENTWKAGLERLLLGYALPGKGERMFEGILPYDDIEGTEAQVLGHFLDFIQHLFDQMTSLEQRRSMSDWAVALQGLLERFFTSNESTEAELHVLQKLLGEFKDIEEKAGFEEKIEIEVVRSYLADRLDHQVDTLRAGFLTGGVTFCTMLPMRSIPFRVVALVGMNEEDFPRMVSAVGFDLMAQAPRVGDPSKRHEDRYLFLEALLSAREKLYISYVGQSIRDNSPIPPSVLVSELLDAIDRGFEHPTKKTLDYVVTYHRLQAFSPAYFNPRGSLFSYSEENCRALCARLKEPVQQKPFITEPLPEQSDEWKTLNLTQLIQFLANPARFFLSHQLGIRLEAPSSHLEEREPFDVLGLEKYQLEQELVQKKLQEVKLEDYYPLLKAQGVLPPGTSGEVTYQDLCTDVEDFAAKVQQHTAMEKLAPPDVDIDIDEFRLMGRIEGIWSGGLLRYRCASIKAKDYLAVWVEHLALNCLAQEGYPAMSLLIGSDYQYRFHPVPDSRKILKKLLQIYWRGMQIPLPFFPKTSLAYAEKFLDTGDVLKALYSAGKSWEGNDFSMGEAEDPYLQLCFGKVENLLGEDFQALALEIFEPLLSYREKVLTLNKGNYTWQGHKL